MTTPGRVGDFHARLEMSRFRAGLFLFKEGIWQYTGPFGARLASRFG